MSRRQSPTQAIRDKFQSILSESVAAAGVVLDVLKQDHQTALAGLTTQATPAVAGKKGRGRPAGSKNQPKPNGQPAAVATVGAKGKPGPKPKAASPSLASAVQPSLGAQAAGAEKFDSIGE